VPESSLTSMVVEAWGEKSEKRTKICTHQGNIIYKPVTKKAAITHSRIRRASSDLVRLHVSKGDFALAS